ncbi:MAG TPA: hypothetical protein VJ878_04790 [Candidatus Izemoplasmatales bacterium]|nr:hypothetical protein [Candidatus Izemoplasmatales bacterium]
MTKFIKEWKKLIHEMGWINVIDAYFGALFYIFIIFVPMSLVYAQIISMFYHLLNLWVVLIMISVIILSYIQKRWWKKSLLLKDASLDVDLNHIFLIQQVIWSIMVITLGILFVFVFIPNMQI